jgi:hypothetical protein
LVTAWAWRRLFDRDPGRSLARPAVLWCLHAIPGDDPIWIPFGHDDIRREAARALAVFRDAGIRDGDVVLSVAPPGPWVANATPYLISTADSLDPDQRPLAAEVLPLSVLTVSFKADLTLFPFGRAPSVLVASAADALAIADLARSAGAPPLHCRLLLLYGPATDRARVSGLADTCVDLLHLPGAFAPFGGRPGEVGVWLPQQAVSGELIPDEEWGQAVQTPAYVPQALPLASASGLSGELVVSVPNEALPVIRFRTQERVRVLQVDPERGIRIERMAPAHARPVEEPRLPSLAQAARR